MTEQETFTTRLRRHRERNRVRLDEISRDSRVKLELLEGLERNDLSEWPKGLYARAYVRAYAAAIGLDGDDTVNEFCRLFPHGDRRAEPVIREIASIVASQSQFEYDFKYATEADRRRSAAPPPAHERKWWDPLFDVVRSLRGRVGSLRGSPAARTTRSATR